MAGTLKDIESLLDAVEASRDNTGSLAVVAELMAKLRPSIVLLADQDGHLLGVDDPTGGQCGELAAEAANRMAAMLEKQECWAGEDPMVGAGRGLVALRIPTSDGWDILGALVASKEPCEEWLLSHRDVLLPCGRLARKAILVGLEARREHTENKHLRSEHATLRAAHTEAVIAAIREREEKASIEAKRAALEHFLTTAERTNRSRGDFLAQMSQEIRTPLTSILGYTELLGERLMRPEDREVVGTIERNGELLLEIVNDILDISRIESGKLEVERVPCSPHEIVDDVCRLLAPRAKSKGLTFDHDFVGPIPETIRSDPLRVKQILLNLVGNAIKFTTSGGVQVSTRLSSHDMSEPKLRIEVTDTGAGLSDEQISDLFDPLLEGKRISSRRYGGSGLGLTISKRLSGMLGGDITVRSVRGAGSTFSAIISTGSLVNVKFIEGKPRVKDATDDLKRETTRQEPLDANILVVEDSIDNQRLITVFLERAGAKVQVVEDGQAAVLRAMAGVTTESGVDTSFDVILMDIDMPVLNGLDATRRLRDAGYMHPIIALTARVDEAFVEKCLDVGCDAFVPKPIRREHLLDAIRKLLAENSVKSPTV